MEVPSGDFVTLINVEFNIANCRIQLGTIDLKRLQFGNLRWLGCIFRCRRTIHARTERFSPEIRFSTRNPHHER